MYKTSHNHLVVGDEVCVLNSDFQKFVVHCHNLSVLLINVFVRPEHGFQFSEVRFGTIGLLIAVPSLFVVFQKWQERGGKVFAEEEECK